MSPAFDRISQDSQLVKIRELFSNFSRYNLFINHNFEMAPKRTDSHTTPWDVVFMDFTRSLPDIFLY